ncbi:beta-1,3-galactosyltransferase 5 [Leptopilina heterotoma]|uniref:beta-1,3-galactosyltransferase 5 n=1 Tax=Leptopilina heterotoma TaxID=63436 RepID=UPI001CA9377E|nr:beta-1,3-galactosyltransferase 5 [Leptopilina heterotoma]XP_043466991.1 beta-1,3-galactosyltransferase 5 [Leptopilina heterotoma]XP_043466992.1 beta-1,3-galactosyltransferase 5 [Leptopilina heterotoma]XP_043466993.1 beta-1,3-galactosyltransferase 5 [Leptopilina heterotoma]
MLDKRRLPAFGSSSCYFIFVLALTFTGCAFFWCRSAYQVFIVLPANVMTTPTYVLVPPGNSTEYSHSFKVSELSNGDENTLIDLKNFKFLLNHDMCNKTQPLLLMMVHSAPKNFDKRNVIRETWGRASSSSSSSVTTIFLVGWSEEYQAELETEDLKYGDLIQGNFLDAYRNMTYKHVMALKWATYHCPSAKYILKLDDDVFVHITAVLDFLKHHLSPWGARRLMICDPINAKVKRSYRSKWRVSPREYPGRHYPLYCAGWGIFYSPDTAFLLYREAQKEPYFWIDDVHITGTIARKVNLTQVSLHSLVLSKQEKNDILQNSACSKNFLFGSPDLTAEEIRALHSIVSRGSILSDHKFVN